MAVTLTTLLLRSRRRADMEDDDFIEDTEATDLVNQSYLELCEEVWSHDPDWRITTASFTLTGGTEALSRYSIPPSNTTLWSLRSVEKDPDTANRRLIRRFTRRNPPDTDMSSAGADARYRIEGAYIVFEPYESAAGNYRIRYIHGPSLMSTGGGDAGAVNLDTELERWAEYVILRTAIKMRDKDEQDTSSLWNELDRMRIRIAAWACKRDGVDPKVVPDPAE